jgi:signal peptide peptidase SppA
MRYPQVARAVLETPWAILPQTLAAILDMLALRTHGEKLSEEEIQARIGNGPARKDVYMAGSTAVIPIHGVIVPRADQFSEMSGGTSVQRLRDALATAVSDKEVKSIVLEIDSPGGQTAMIPEFAAEIRQARGVKPVTAVANTSAGSAAYWLGSQASEFVVTPSGSAGSIGVFAAHEDISGLQEKAGVKTTLVSAGKYKTESSPFEPLTDEAKAAIQQRVDDSYQQFTLDVAKGRRVAVETVRNGFGEGRVLPAKAALREGLVDRIATFDTVISEGFSTGSTSAVFFDGDIAGPLRAHSTATSDKPWDGAANKANLRNDGGETYFKTAFAWQDDQADPDLKGSYKFIHHEVNANGDVGAANLTACSQGIGVLNGGRTGTTIPDSDRQGVYNHLAQHLKDGGKEPPPLALDITETRAASSGLSFADEAFALHDRAEALVERTRSLAELRDRGRLGASKRERLAACTEALRATAAEIDSLLVATDPEKPRLEFMAEIARFEARRLQGGTAR